MMKTSLFALILTTVKAQLPTNVTFIHINDHHSHFEDVSFDIQDSAFIPDTLNVTSSNIRMYYGGFARAVGLMKAIEADALASGNDVCKVHAGDALTGTIFYTFFNSDMDVAAMNVAGFDAFVVGNHEFDEGDANLAKFVEALDAPTLSTAIPGESSPLRSLSEAKAMKTYMIKKLGNGEQLGICGITIKSKTELSSFPDPGTTIADEQQAAQLCVDELEGQGINKILMLTHIGYERDLEWIANIPGVDVVIGGDSHSLLGSQDFEQIGFPTQGLYSQLIDGTCVVQAWEYVRVVGELSVSFDANGVVTSCGGAARIPINPNRYTVRDADPRFDLSQEDAQRMTEFLLNITDSPFVNVEEDSEIIDVLQPFFNASEEERNTVIAQVSSTICHTYTEQDPECPNKVLQNWLSGGVCNLVSQGFLREVPNAEISIQNRGGCRVDILEGDLTFGDVFDVLPFANTLYTFEMTGTQIHMVLEDALNFFLGPLDGGRGSYPFAAGLRFDLDYTMEFGDRVTNIEVNPRLEGEWTPIGLEETYTVVTNSFIGSGLDGYFTFLNVTDSLVDTYLEYGQSFVNFASDEGSLEEPPLSEYSTQSIKISDNATYFIEEEETPSEDEEIPTETENGETTSSAFRLGVQVASVALHFLVMLV